MVATSQPVDVDAFVDEWREWHATHEAKIGDRHGFLAVTSINWLTDEPQRFPDAPGEWTSNQDSVRVVLADGESISVNGEEVTGTYDFVSIAERGGISANWISGGKDVVLEVAQRGGRNILRPRHPDAPLVTAYKGTPAYDPDPKWAVAARYVPFDSPRKTEVGAAVEGIRHDYEAPGQVQFEIDGQALALTVFGSPYGKGFNVLFTDLTSGTTTWPANRSLMLGAPADDGSLIIDFNRATNLPCAYTDLATCPLPPAENRLPVEVTAGEKIPYERNLGGDHSSN